jgi:hypothetical protein
MSKSEYLFSFFMRNRNHLQACPGLTVNEDGVWRCIFDPTGGLVTVCAAIDPDTGEVAMSGGNPVYDPAAQEQNPNLLHSCQQ